MVSPGGGSTPDRLLPAEGAFEDASVLAGYSQDACIVVACETEPKYRREIKVS